MHICQQAEYELSMWTTNLPWFYFLLLLWAFYLLSLFWFLSYWSIWQVILFSDILTPLSGMNIPFDIIKGKGPVIFNPLRTADDVEQVREFVPEDSVPYVGEALTILRKEVLLARLLFNFLSWISFLVHLSYSLFCEPPSLIKSNVVRYCWSFFIWLEVFKLLRLKPWMDCTNFEKDSWPSSSLQYMDSKQ